MIIALTYISKGYYSERELNDNDWILEYVTKLESIDCFSHLVPYTYNISDAYFDQYINATMNSNRIWKVIWPLDVLKYEYPKISVFVPLCIILSGLFSLAQVLVWSFEDRPESSLRENMDNFNNSENMIERRRQDEGWRKEDCEDGALRKYANKWKKKAKIGKWQKYVYNPTQVGCFRRIGNLIYLVFNNIWQNYWGEFAN